MALEPIFGVTTQNFQAEVVQRSRDVTVILYFWTDQAAVSVEMKETLEQLAGQYQGKFVLGEVDVAKEPMIAQQLRVRGVPSLKVLRDGQLVDELEGPQGEAVLREMMDRLTMSSSEKLRDDLQVFLDEKRYDQALAMLQQALQGEPDNPSFKVELADLLILTGDLDSARQLLASLDEAIEERDRPAARLEFMEEAAGLPTRAELLSSITENHDDLEARYGLCVRDAVEERFEEALELAMDILRRDREFRDEIGRKTMIRIFSLLGKGSELAKQYRRRMFNFLH
ncbi:MAG: tetratricopeptide repeat protein [Gammaproteobacteria bacterium]|nr:tetratricopeptide repeat protein [Gammaproteobacteria bacterium]